MKSTSHSLYCRGVFIFAAVCVFANAPEFAVGQTASGWKGTTNFDFQTSSNWDNGFGSNFNLFVGNAWVTAGRGGQTTLNNGSNYSGYRITFENITSPVTFTIQGLQITLFDFGGNDPKLENDSGIIQNFNGALVLNGQNGGQKGEINPVNGDLSIGNTVDLAGTTQLQIFGNNGKTVTFNGVISSSGNSNNNSVAINQNSTVVYAATNTYAGDTFVNAGTLQFGTSGSAPGSANNSTIRLGDTSGSNNATITLATAAGSNSITSVLNPRAGTSGTLTLQSLNTSGTNTWSGHIGMDHDLTVTETNSGGIFALTSVHGSDTTTGIDIKGNTITFKGAGNINVLGTLYNSTGTGTVAYGGTGTLTLSGTNAYSKETDINSGTVALGNNSGAGTGTIFVGNGGTTTTAATLLLNASGLTVSNAMTENAGSGGNRTIGSSFTNAGTSTYSGTLTLTDGNATLQAATGGTVAFNTITASSPQTVAVGTSGNTGTVQLGGTADNVNLGAIVNFGTLVLNKTSSSTVHAIGNGLTINNGAIAQLSGTGGDQIFNSSSVTVNNGGTFKTAGLSEGIRPTNGGATNGAAGMGALTLQSNNSSLHETFNFGSTTAGSSLVFSSLAASSKGAFVDILNWGGTANTDNGATTNDRLLFASDPGFSATDLANFAFSGFATGATEIAYGNLFEIVPIPEPGSWLAGALAFIALFATQRRRLSRIMQAEIRSRNLPDNL